MIIGAQKAGTTALFDFLSMHADLAAPRKKELNYFGCELRYRRGSEFYDSFFPARLGPGDDRKSFEASPHYLFAAETSAARLKSFDPEMRLIALLRNPIDRAYSAWQMYQRFSLVEEDQFEKWVCGCDGDAEAATYEARRSGYGESFLDDLHEELDAEQRGVRVQRPVIGHGRYADQLTIFLDAFNAEQLLIIDSSAMENDPIGQLRRVESHLHLSSQNWGDVDLAPRFVGAYSDPLPGDARALLSEHYGPYNERLESMLGTSFNWQ